MIPEIEPDSEWYDRKIAERWINYVTQLLPVGINNLMANDYKSEQYKIRRATKYVCELIEDGVIKKTEVIEDRISTTHWVDHHPLYGSFDRESETIKSVRRLLILGKDLLSYECSKLKPQEPLISVDKAMKGEMNSENKKRNREGGADAKNFIKIGMDDYKRKHESQEFPMTLDNLLRFSGEKGNVQGYTTKEEYKIGSNGRKKAIVFLHYDVDQDEKNAVERDSINRHFRAYGLNPVDNGR